MYTFGVTNMDKIEVIVLAAGKGTRLNSGYPSPKPKVLYEICGKPMILYTLENIIKSGIKKIIVVVGYKKNQVIKVLSKYKTLFEIKIAVQKKQKGTAHALLSAKKAISKDTKHILVVNGDDTAFLKPETIKKLVKKHFLKKNKITFISTIRKNPSGLGRIKRNKSGKITGIIEQKEATEGEKKIKETNTGIYIFEKKWVFENLPKISLSHQGEYYLTDIIELAILEGEKIEVITENDESQFIGVNSLKQLHHANCFMKKNQLTKS